MTAYEIAQRVLRRLDDDPAHPASVAPSTNPDNPVPVEILAAISEGQELAAMLTLCLETTVDFPLTAGVPFYGLRTLLPDYLCPLRITVNGVKLNPRTLAELDMENGSWQAAPGTPSKYLAMGFGFFGVSPQPAADATARFTYAKSPAPVIADQFLEIPEGYHWTLEDYAVYKVRLKEGAQGLARGVKCLNRALDAWAELGDFVRSKSKGYDVQPFELKLFDRARLVKAISARAKH